MISPSNSHTSSPLVTTLLEPKKLPEKRKLILKKNQYSQSELPLIRKLAHTKTSIPSANPEVFDLWADKQSNKKEKAGKAIEVPNAGISYNPDEDSHKVYL